MLVSAAIAAYLPPLALVPQMEIATRRPPTSRAVFAATKNTTRNRLICMSEQKCDRYAQPLLENPQIAVPLGEKKIVGSGLRLSSQGETIYYVMPTIQGVATGGVKKFVGSRHAEIAMPMKKSCFQGSENFSHHPYYELVRVPIRIRLGRLHRGAP